MRISIDINDVLRDFIRNFAKYYKTGYDHTFDYDNISEVWTNDLQALFPFKSERAYETFIYNDYPYEIFGVAPAVDGKLPGLFSEWYKNIIPNIDCGEPIEINIVSTKEYGLSIPSTLFFLSKFGIKTREFYFPEDSLTIWDKCDVLVTANPILLDSKPEGKISVKIEQDYNEKSSADFSYLNMKLFVSSEEGIMKIIDKKNGK